MQTPKILLVEDEDLIRVLLCEAMAEDGFTVVATTNGAEALVYLSSGEMFDLLLTDIQLPGPMDGLDIARVARSTAPFMPIIFTTGQPDRMGEWHPSVRETFIPKPYRPSEICAAVRRLTEASALPHQDRPLQLS